MVLTSFLGTGLILLLTMLGLGGSGIVPLGEAALLGFALSFSSTVLVVKTLEERGDTRSLYGRTAICPARGRYC